MKKLRELVRHFLQRRGVVPRLPPFSAYHGTDAGIRLSKLMVDRYTVANLREVSAEKFRADISALESVSDPAMEGYASSSCQRDQSLKFEWGHNHDFGIFYMPGQMGNRHIDVLATFMDLYGVREDDFRGKKVLDIGCWTGGAALLLAAMGADVVAVEEVRKYVDCVEYLKQCFGVDNLQVENRSLYSLDDEGFRDRFDIVLYSGVLYHVSDPVLSLRIVFNCLKDGGTCLLETMAVGGSRSCCVYEGARHTLDRPKEQEPRVGWNWFVPSLEAVRRMMIDVGFNVRQATLHKEDRALVLGTRTQHMDMLRAGLSNRHVR